MSTPAIDAAIEAEMLFRLLFRTQDDRYETENAGPLLQALYRLDDESAQVSIRLHAMDAERKVARNGFAFLMLVKMETLIPITKNQND